MQTGGTVPVALAPKGAANDIAAMLGMFRRRKTPRGGGHRSIAMAPGERAYAIGDVHGRLDLLKALWHHIEAEIAEARGIRCHVILLGDLVDRGPDSAGVVEWSRQWQASGTDRHVLGGNHEDMMLVAFRKPGALRSFLRYGGRETLLSYGITEDELRRTEIEELQSLMAERVPESHRTYLEGLADSVRLGDYLFVHAGIAPDIPLADQQREAMRWIREPFLSHEGELEAFVVHGHTITPEPDEQSCRIGIDTGAYSSGRLTALVLEGTGRRFMETSDEDGAITVSAMKPAQKDVS